MHQKDCGQALPIVVHSYRSKLKDPRQLAAEMLQDLRSSRELAWRLLVRDISAQYRQSYLGFFWAFIPPIVMAVGLTLASNAKVITFSETDVPYPAYVMFNTVIWQTFVEAVQGPIQAVTQAKLMLAKINFPREALILAKLGEVGFNFAIKLVLIVGLFIWFHIPVSWTIVLAPVALIHLIFLGTLVGVFLAPLSALYQDFSKSLTLLTGFWLFLTPVIYPVPQEGTFSWLVRLNPVTPLLVTLRELTTASELSSPVGFWIASAIALIGLLLAWVIYRLAMPFAIERMSS
ncbi:ABC transporter permease [Sphaerothrix gracilis]|uniref:ABC transporter permease n=1 Tax=Sphaerothrix gracilis TaxID=3151835 RepID=UPI0031FCDD4E